MKKFLLAVMALFLSFSANAFEFDGIDLNGSVADITKQVSAKGYVFDQQKNALKGNCQGTEIFLTFNYVDVKTQGKIGQFIVDIPMAEPNAFEVMTKTFNIIYHLVGKGENGGLKYSVSTDGTSLCVTKTADGVRLTYNTPNYNK